MLISFDIACIVPIIVPLIIGLLVGLIVKHTIKLMFAIALLVFSLVLFGSINITYQDIFTQVLELLPTIIGAVSILAETLPYSSLTFIIGLALGLWKG